MDIKSLLGSKIKEHRKKRGLTQEKFSELIEMNPRQVVRIENGVSFPSAENLEKIVSVLGINIRELFENEDEEQKEILKTKIKYFIDKVNEKDLNLIYNLAERLAERFSG